MSTIARHISSGLGLLHRSLDRPKISWLGSEYNCVPSNIRKSAVNTPGGFETPTAFTVAILKKDLPVPPVASNRVSFGGQTYIVQAVNESADGSHHRLELAVKMFNR